MPLELYIENANLSDSHDSSLSITGVAQPRLGNGGKVFRRCSIRTKVLKAAVDRRIKKFWRRNRR
jgi:hypothetical protein